MAHERLRVSSLSQQVMLCLRRRCRCIFNRASSWNPTTEKRRVVHVNRSSATPDFPSNKVSNTKYSAWTFLPKNLYEQFKAPMNLYFLMIAFLQLWPAITPVNPITTWAPLLLVTAISGFKEAVDDLRRHRADEAANERLFHVYQNGVLRSHCRSADILVGDIVAMPDGVELPCDLLLLRVSAPANAGVAFIETSNLDGETDLKVRQARPETQSLAEGGLGALLGEVHCEPPNADLYRFDAQLKLCATGGERGRASSSATSVAISANQLLQHGTLLRKTGGIYGVAVYTGGDTKLNQNKSQPPTKIALIDATINKYVIYIFLAQMALVALFGLLGHLYSGTGVTSIWYLGWPAESTVSHGDHTDVLNAIDVDSAEWETGMMQFNHSSHIGVRLRGGWASASSNLPRTVIVQPWYTFLVLPLRFLLLSSMMVPISLKVTLDLVKLAYAFLINADVEMYDSRSDLPASAANTAITEDLGRLEYILTDKTGTLTENVMTLHAVTVGVVAHGPSLLTSPATSPGSSSINNLSGSASASCTATGGTGGASGGSSGGSVRWPEAGLFEPSSSIRRAMEVRSAREAEFCRALALCNTVQPEHIDALPLPPPPHIHDNIHTSHTSHASHSSGSVGGGRGGAHVFPHAVATARLRCIQYASASPDEEALVHGAAQLGVALSYRVKDAEGGDKVTLSLNPTCFGIDRGGDVNHVTAAAAASRDRTFSVCDEDAKRVWVRDDDIERTYTVLHTLEFTSARKCMSVILRRIDVGRPRGDEEHPAFSAPPNESELFGPGYAGVDGDEIVILTKGADEVLRAKLQPCSHGCSSTTSGSGVAAQVREAVEGSLLRYSQEGLRTLMIGARTITSAEYAAWLSQWERANHEVHDRQHQIEEACAAIEHGLVLLGCTAIEDKLQPGVAEAVCSLRTAGIKVWMLTGDKAETAMQIATAARIIDATALAQYQAASRPAATGAASNVNAGVGGVAATPLSAVVTWSTPRAASQLLCAPDTPLVIRLSGNEESELEAGIQAGLAQLEAVRRDADLNTPSAIGGGGGSTSTKHAHGSARGSGSSLHASTWRVGRTAILVVEGIQTIKHATSAHLSGSFAKLALSCDTVLCCRCLPSQKASLTRLVRAAGHVCLAVGDGGNDVAMIQVAHIGVGISGREGKQATRASDFSISQFRFLRDLVLVHGRYANYRTSLVAQYTFYKSMCICFVQMGFNCFCAFSGCSLLDTFSLTTYNLIYTFLPGVLLVLDRDKLRSELVGDPSHYRASQSGEWISFNSFISWCGRALVQAVLLLLLHVAALQTSEGGGVDQTVLSYGVYTSLVLIQVATVATEMTRITYLNHAVNAGCVLLYLALVSLRNALPAESSSLGTLSSLLTGESAAHTIVLGVVGCVLPWVAVRSFRAYGVFGDVSASAWLCKRLIQGRHKGKQSASTRHSREATLPPRWRASSDNSSNTGDANGESGEQDAVEVPLITIASPPSSLTVATFESAAAATHKPPRMLYSASTGSVGARLVPSSDASPWQV